MPQEEISVRLRFATEEMKDHFLERFPSQILTVQRLDTDARCVYLQSPSESEPSNASASQSTDVSSGSTQPVPPRTSSNVPVEQAVSDQGAPVKHSTMVTQLSTRFEAEQTQKKKHTVHCFLHGAKCDTYGTPKECEENYDKEFASRFEEFLGKGPTASLASANNEDTPDDNFLAYIEQHLQAMNCPSLCSRLWRYCLDNQLFSVFKYVPEGLLIHSNGRQNLICTIVKTYSGYRNVKWIGRGTFGNVYQYSDQTAVKEEFRRPLITGSAVLFQRIVELSHPNVIEVLEYIVGPYGKDRKKCFLSVMSYKNQKDLSKQFSKEHKEHLTCVLDYMQEYQHQEKFIFRNYTVLFRHVFEGLCYLKSKGIVYRDIKSSNILVHQNCACQSPLQCICAGDGDVTYLLGDMDLLSLEEESANSTYTCDEWKKMVCHDPAGTIGMKPPESFFRNEKGEHVTTHKSDVWSTCVTMMNVLIGIAVNDEAQKEIGKFITAATEGTKTATKSVTDSSSLLHSIMTTFTSVFDQMRNEQSNIYTGLVNNEMSELNTNLNSLKHTTKVENTGPAKSKSITQMTEKERAELRAKKFGVSEEEAKKMARRERFGPVDGGLTKRTKLSEEEMEKFKARAARFGSSVAPALTSIEDDAKRKERAKKFGAVPVTSMSAEARKQMRSAKFQ